MMKTSENDFIRAALQQSLQFWRGDTRASPSQAPTLSPSSEASVTKPRNVTRPIAEMRASSHETGPRPWRYIRWRKAHDRLPRMAKERQEGKKGNFYHRVLPDEDLIEVADKFTTYPEVLMEANHVLNPINIATGQLLWVPRTHPIDWGNTLWALSRKFNVPISTIQKANGIVNPDLIYAGDVLIVPEEPNNRTAF